MGGRFVLDLQGYGSPRSSGNYGNGSVRSGGSLLPSNHSNGTLLSHVVAREASAASRAHAEPTTDRSEVQDLLAQSCDPELLEIMNLMADEGSPYIPPDDLFDLHQTAVSSGSESIAGSRSHLTAVSDNSISASHGSKDPQHQAGPPSSDGSTLSNAAAFACHRDRASLQGRILNLQQAMKLQRERPTSKLIDPNCDDRLVCGDSPEGPSCMDDLRDLMILTPEGISPPGPLAEQAFEADQRYSGMPPRSQSPFSQQQQAANGSVLHSQRSLPKDSDMGYLGLAPLVLKKPSSILGASSPLPKLSDSSRKSSGSPLAKQLTRQLRLQGSFDGGCGSPISSPVIGKRSSSSMNPVGTKIRQSSISRHNNEGLSTASPSAAAATGNPLANNSSNLLSAINPHTLGQLLVHQQQSLQRQLAEVQSQQINLVDLQQQQMIATALLLQQQQDGSNFLPK